MKIGNVTLSEGASIKNLTLPSGATFPTSANLGEKFRLTEALDQNTPAGEYSHDGTQWHNQPSLEDVKALLSAGGSTYFRQIFEARVGLGASAAGTAVFTNAALTTVTGGNFGIAAAAPMPTIWIDPADYPAGTKLRVRSQLFSNISTSAGFGISLRKVTRQASQASGTTMGYTLDGTVLGLVSHTLIEQASLRNATSAEFDMPASAGLYAFAFVQTGAMTANSAAHITAQLQAKY